MPPVLLGQNGAKKDPEQGGSKEPREHDRADCNGNHGRFISVPILPETVQLNNSQVIADSR